MTSVTHPVLNSFSEGERPREDGCTQCTELLLREVCSFHRAVAEQFGLSEAAKAVDDWMELLEDVSDGQRDAALAGRRATILSAERLSSRICEGRPTRSPAAA